MLEKVTIQLNLTKHGGLSEEESKRLLEQADQRGVSVDVEAARLIRAALKSEPELVGAGE